eukprot:Lankesteria_metandrocarpae@DN5125_c0_g1_i1.p1
MPFGTRPTVPRAETFASMTALTRSGSRKTDSIGMYIQRRATATNLQKTFSTAEGMEFSSRIDMTGAREIAVSELTSDHVVVREEVVEVDIVVPKRVITEDIIEKHLIIPEKRVAEEVVEEIQKVQQKLIEVKKVIVQERTVEVPEVVFTEKIVEYPEKIIQEKLVHTPVIVLEERIVEVIKIIPVEKIVEVPEIEMREVVVEKLVEQIVEVEEIRIVEKPVPRYIEIPMPQFVTKEEEKDIDRIVPVPLEAIQVIEFTLPRLRPMTCTRVPITMYAPRFIEVPVPADALVPSQIKMCESLSEEVHKLAVASAHRPIAYEEIERVSIAANAFEEIMQASLSSAVQNTEMNILSNYESGLYSVTGEPEYGIPSVVKKAEDVYSFLASHATQRAASTMQCSTASTARRQYSYNKIYNTASSTTPQQFIQPATGPRSTPVPTKPLFTASGSTSSILGGRKLSKPVIPYNTAAPQYSTAAVHYDTYQHIPVQSSDSHQFITASHHYHHPPPLIGGAPQAIAAVGPAVAAYASRISAVTGMLPGNPLNHDDLQNPVNSRLKENSTMGPLGLVASVFSRPTNQKPLDSRASTFGHVPLLTKSSSGSCSAAFAPPTATKQSPLGNQHKPGEGAVPSRASSTGSDPGRRSRRSRSSGSSSSSIASRSSVHSDEDVAQLSKAVADDDGAGADSDSDMLTPLGDDMKVHVGGVDATPAPTDIAEMLNAMEAMARDDDGVPGLAVGEAAGVANFAVSPELAAVAAQIAAGDTILMGDDSSTGTAVATPTSAVQVAYNVIKKFQYGSPDMRKLVGAAPPSDADVSLPPVIVSDPLLLGDGELP